jgi:hypothetical protein
MMRRMDSMKKGVRMKRWLGIFLLVLSPMLFAPIASHANNIVSLGFNPPIQTASPGSSITFSGTLGVTGTPGAVFINGDTINTSAGFGFAGDPFSLFLDDLSFFLNAPFTISSDDLNGPSSATFNFFDVTIGAQVAPGTYFGTFYVLGGADSFDQNILALASFQIDVTPGPTPAPEPGTLALLSTGVIGLGVLRRRKTPKGPSL